VSLINKKILRPDFFFEKRKRKRVILPLYVLFHEFTYCCSRIRFQVTKCFSNKRPTHFTWWKIKLGFGLFSFDENENEHEKKRKN
jgi:lysophospholipid acyltransferase (LPLAT)-like uncharacterized protein